MCSLEVEKAAASSQRCTTPRSCSEELDSTSLHGRDTVGIRRRAINSYCYPAVVSLIAFVLLEPELIFLLLLQWKIYLFLWHFTLKGSCQR